ncbi:MAG: TonB-dependent receptor [Cyclobacteriaceae bacterium]
MSQTLVKGHLSSAGEPVMFATVAIKGSTIGSTTDENGYYELQVPEGKHTVALSSVGYYPVTRSIEAKGGTVTLDFEMEVSETVMDAVVVTGTMKEVNRMESPVPVEVFNPVFFKKNPTPNIFDALQNVNGVRPQLNCNVCNTGDIHINGLEGPYTMVLIDGMPIVSSLATVYGLSGIPNAMVERIEIVKGPASSLYGSEAVGGLINIITKKPQNAPIVSVDVFGTSWQEYSADLGIKANVGKVANVLTGINYFNYNNIVDNNGDNFTDVTLQHRISVFQKWNIERKSSKLFTLAGRFYDENRWGGDVRWTEAYRGGSELYGESIYTRRWELLGTYQLPLTEPIFFNFSYNTHDQNSVYGDVPYIANQQIAFGQLTWDKSLTNHELLAGTAIRFNAYDDNTSATAEDGVNQPDKYVIPGLFLQDEIKLGTHKTLLGLRYDYHNEHGSILTPRLAYKLAINDQNILRLNAGTGFRVVNLFTEEHAALTGARDVVVMNELKPEKSYNVNLNYLKKIYLNNGGFIGFDAASWYTHFTNKIIPDYETNSDQIIYDNLSGHAVSKGISVNADIEFLSGLKFVLGGTMMDVSDFDKGVKHRQLLTEQYTGTWAVSYQFARAGLALDYTGNIYGSMELPVLGELDPRSDQSPAWSIQNIQFTYKKLKNMELYGGIKNLLNWTPNKGNPFIIARAHDPFDQQVEFDGAGNVRTTSENPYGLTFDAAYVYGPNQGIRGFFGFRYTFR